MLHWAVLARELLPWLALLVAAVPIYTFWKAARTRRAEWLGSLHSKFFEGDQYKEIRRILDYELQPQLARLYTSLNGDGDSGDLAEKAVDYLNFFELIASLRRLRQLSACEIRMLFDYYLRLLTRHPPIMAFIQTQGFENLSALLKKYHTQ